ncbi:MAG: undecaprenyl-diphosphate phosphatase [Dysgonamonadaceae bacterium]|nr:undecaprenyl-diphosphate phosphatase [Dysgonamonadaceae bacterium]MDD3309195.1 undecaprenyl-diphosphate phosphatase [Dysgonamonadaceae bacterium]MDD3899702.1 undecaprenyl-diphosphate phosphatase [Dysgonamonadaceae bacterium]MDD4398019.1 undecaprenyl-diphosphate phosphatase [Dysgonamonadaceae bacterium]
MSYLEAIIIAIVEGLTEFLPVSSTGHMIIVQALLGIESTEFTKFFTVNIQFGAILSVVVLYWNRFFKMKPIKVFDKETVKGLSGWNKLKTYINRFINKFDFYWKLFLACIPGLVLGLLFGDAIDAALGSVIIVCVMLVIGGVLMLFVDVWLKNTSENQSISTKRAWLIGLSQCAAMFLPGLSRSMATILGGMATKLNRRNAAEFSFFLAVPTMLGASLIKMIGVMKEPGGASLLLDNLMLLIVGNVVAFIVAMIAVKFFIDYLTKHGFKSFGIYRIIVGGFLLTLILSGYNLSMF